MENPKACLIEEHLFDLESTAYLGVKPLALLTFLKEIISNSLTFSDHQDKVIIRDGANTIRLLDCPKIKSFLAYLGFHQENGTYVHKASDENTIKLQSCLQIIEAHLKIQEVALEKSQKTRIEALPAERSNSREGSSGNIKELFLSRHLKKDRLDNMVILSKSSRKPISRASDFTFNTNGFFCQSANKKDARRSTGRCFRDLFHQQDHDTKHLNSSFINTKLF